MTNAREHLLPGVLPDKTAQSFFLCGEIKFNSNLHLILRLFAQIDALHLPVDLTDGL